MKKEKNGFSIKLHSKKQVVENYIVYFENKNNKIVYCYIQDSFINILFRAKAKCHDMDVFDKKIAYELAFSRCLEKRDRMYEKFLKKITGVCLDAKNRSINIEKKFYKFLQSTN